MVSWVTSINVWMGLNVMGRCCVSFWGSKCVCMKRNMFKMKVVLPRVTKGIYCEGVWLTHMCWVYSADHWHYLMDKALIFSKWVPACWYLSSRQRLPCGCFQVLNLPSHCNVLYFCLCWSLILLWAALNPLVLEGRWARPNKHGCRTAHVQWSHQEGKESYKVWFSALSAFRPPFHPFISIRGNLRNPRVNFFFSV